MLAESLVPEIADAHMFNFISVYSFEYRHRRCIAYLLELVDHRRCYIESTRLHDARHEGHAMQRIVPGLAYHIPQSPMRRESPVIAITLYQGLIEQLKMAGLLSRDPQPVTGVLTRRTMSAANDR